MRCARRLLATDGFDDDIHVMRQEFVEVVGEDPGIDRKVPHASEVAHQDSCDL